ncbi:MAG: serine/threonine-protein kinase [Planctomycetota bacterium]|jgi:serine/threonine protein kinase
MPADRTDRAAADARFYELCAELDALPARRRGAALERAIQRHPEFAQSLRDYYRAGDALAGGLAAARENVPHVPNANAGADPGLAAMSQLLVQLRREGQFAAPLQLGAELGKGGWGRVCEAEDPHLGCLVAVKSLSRQVVKWVGEQPVISEPRALARFLEEAQVASQLDHPGVIPIHRLGVDASGAPFFTMKLVRGVTLEEALEVQAGQRTELLHDKPWTLRRLLSTLERVAEALSYAHHKGVVHRDVKPQNILVGHHGETYLLDWGLARVVSEGRPATQGQAGWVTSVPRSVRENYRGDARSPLRTAAHEVLGTPCYMAPESLSGLAEREGSKAYSLDVYSLGAILYRALAGHPPYLNPTASNRPEAVLARVATGDPTPIHTLAPQAPARLLALCASSMARDPAQRPATVDHWLHELRRVLAGEASNAARLEHSVRSTLPRLDATEPMPGRWGARQPEPAPQRPDRRPSPAGSVAAHGSTEPVRGARIARALPAPAAPGPQSPAPESSQAGPDGDTGQPEGGAASARAQWAFWLPWILLTFALGLWAGRFSS